MKFLHFVTILIIGTVAQVSLFSEIPFTDVYYELLFAITVFIGLKFNWYEGCIAGIWCGIFNDIFSATNFGYSVLTYGLSGFLAAFFENIIFTQYTGTRLLILFIMTLFANIILIFLNNSPLVFLETLPSFKLSLLKIAAINTLFSIPLYIMLDKVPNDVQK
ncbi:MAG: hypothetical protein ACD_79C00991G0001 [uncultured bacterium]|nr:MAG: hypothetical protein ACD_79C00991G0001 [uncultured bacterium]